VALGAHSPEKVILETRRRCAGTTSPFTELISGFLVDGDMLPNSYGKQDCSLARALEIVGERWTLLVLRDAFYGVRRFNDFLAHLDLPRTVLSNRLRSLIEHGLLVKIPDAGHSGRWLYELTDEGMALWPALYALRSWGERQSGRQPRMFTHDACDTPLDATGRCETCGGPTGAQSDLRVTAG